MSKKIIVDADACPKSVKRIIKTLADCYGWEMVTVASINHRMEGEHHIAVGSESQATDINIVNICTKGDIVVTQDWGLAALILGKGAGAVSPHGMIFREDKIGFLLEERHIKEKIRRAGGRTKGPAARGRNDDEHFRHALEQLILFS